MIDAPGRGKARFPPALEDAVRAAIARALEVALPVIAYSQAACGSDILFCEEMLARGQEINIVLPCSREDYVTASVLHGGPDWLPRFERVLAQATSVTYATSERYLGDDTLFEHAANLIQGMALLRARELAVEAGMLAVSDHGQAGGVGGTLSTLDNWKALIPRHEIIDLAELRRQAELPEVATAEPDLPVAAATTARGGRIIKSLLFADVKGFSRLPEEYSPTFFTTFLGLVPRVLKEIGVTPAEISSRGDGLYAVFDRTGDAALFALRLSEAVGAVDWRSMELPPDTHVRIALHAGPVFTAIDPVTNQLAHYGTHVTRAARVEPIVLPGQVLVTEPFAAVLAAMPRSRFRCDLVGTEPLAKGYGVARLYRLHYA
jgi:class 3 adenylate cyclase